VILGTQAVKTPEIVAEACKEFEGHIIVGLDARDGFVATEGWAATSEVKATELAKRFRDDGVSSIVYTDIARDGMMQGVNLAQTVEMANIGIPVIASGGVSQLSDIEAILAEQHPGIIGAITGRAIYEGKLSLAEAQALCDRVARS
jgi:phosphoribosylformimino-5-aminoimidazole carboxamide ribotide isomerase